MTETMNESLDQSESLVQIIRETLELDHVPPSDWNPHRRSDLNWATFQVRPDPDDPGLIGFPSPEERSLFVNQTCQALHVAASDPATHIQAMDSVFSPLAQYVWASTQMSLEGVVEGVWGLLSRLPPTPQPLPGNWQDLPQGYYQNDTCAKSWETLQVVTHLHRNVARVAAHKVICSAERLLHSYNFDRALILVGEMIQTTVLHCESTSDTRALATWSIVRSYLWKFWQTARILYSHVVLEDTFEFGVQHGELERRHTVRNFLIASGLSLRDYTSQCAVETRPDNMCTWMLELWSGEARCAGLDFRILHRRHADAFGGLPARCRLDGQPCAGKSWRDCLRFARAEAMDQTMHDLAMDHDPEGEERVFWDEASYRSLAGPRAISVADSTDRLLRYCVASERTMAISHVWSHGQGGRPSTGMNLCLHRRYKKLAIQLGCNSYWIDAACIPDEDDLRSEAIGFINHVFHHSGAVLIIDRDLMTLNAENPTVQDCEAALAAVLFSDWNTRAWTMLESLKGRNHVGILCRDDQTLSLHQLYRYVSEHGRLDLAIFCLLMPHTLASSTAGVEPFHAMQPLAPWIQNDIKLETVGAWLSHRPASRKFDDVKIWSLCLDPRAKIIKGPVQFWRQQKDVHTGFLLSSAERLAEPGLSWAPSTTFAASKGVDGVDRYYRPLESIDTAQAAIHESGLWGVWDVYNFPYPGKAAPRCGETTQRELDRLRQLFQLPRKRIMLLRPAMDTFLPASETLQSDRSGVKSGSLLAVCDSDYAERRRSPFASRGDRHQYSHRWIWKDVIEWSPTVPLPEFHSAETVWIG